MTGKHCLNHVHSHFRISNPFEVSEGLELRQRGLEDPCRNQSWGLSLSFNAPLTRHEIKHVPFLIGPVESQRLYPARKHWVVLCAVEDVQTAS